MADVTARSLQYEYKAVRGVSGQDSRRPSAVGEWEAVEGGFSLKASRRATKARGKSDLGEGGVTRRHLS